MQDIIAALNAPTSHFKTDYYNAIVRQYQIKHERRQILQELIVEILIQETKEKNDLRKQAQDDAAKQFANAELAYEELKRHYSMAVEQYQDKHPEICVDIHKLIKSLDFLFDTEKSLKAQQKNLSSQWNEMQSSYADKIVDSLKQNHADLYDQDNKRIEYTDERIAKLKKALQLPSPQPLFKNHPELLETLQTAKAAEKQEIASNMASFSGLMSELNFCMACGNGELSSKDILQLIKQNQSVFVNQPIEASASNILKQADITQKRAHNDLAICKISSQLDEKLALLHELDQKTSFRPL